MLPISRGGLNGKVYQPPKTTAGKKKDMELIEKILSVPNISGAAREVVRNKGAGGVDGMTVKDLEYHLKEHREELTDKVLNCNYLPQPIRGKEIKKRNGKTRLLGIPTVIDRTLQQAVARVIMLRYEIDFSDFSYGYRPAHNTHQAVQKSLSYIHAGYQDIVEIDLKGFFDEVNHTLLLQILYRKIKCKATMCLLRRWLRAPLSQDGRLHKRRKGIPQGSPISPLLSNILLNELDTKMEQTGLKFVRYADDFSIYCKSKAEAKKVGNYIYLFLKNKLQLPINKDKSGIRRPSNFQILGYGFTPVFEKGSKGKYQLIVTEKSWKDLKAKLKVVTRKTAGMSFDHRIRKINEIIRGWLNYYKYASIQQKLKALDSWLRQRIRYCIWHDWKKPERKRKNLIRLGVKYGIAYAWSRSRKGGWAIAQSPILSTTITIPRLQKRGYRSMLDIYKSTSPAYQYRNSLFPTI